MHAMFFFRKPPGGPPAGARRRTRLVALAAAVITGLGTVLAVAVATPALAQAGTPPYWAQSPFNVPSGTGATVPFTEYEAESASTNGTIIGPSFAQGSLPSEASGREAVQLTATGQYVKFTLTSPANAFDLHYALAQGASGTLSVYVNGTKLSQELNLTSAYSYITTSSITGSMTHKFYDDARMMFGQTYPAGTTVSFQVGSSDTAVPYTLDVADFYNVPAATTQPANTVSVTSYGADPTGVSDSTSAFNQAITAANNAGEAVWIPSGTFLISSPLQIQKGTIEGAGDWYSQIKTNELIDNTSDVAGPINLSGFAILGSTVGRHDDSTANAIDGSLGSGWTVNGLWIQDTNVGMWLQFGNSNCTVENSVIESTDADGVNFNGNASSCTVKNNFIRGTGDDSLAIWSYPTADSNITFANNTIVAPTLANGIADYGGDNNTISNNVVADDNALGSGIAISNEEFLSPFTPLTGTINVTGNYLIRAGAYNPNWDHPMGAVQFDSYDSAFTGVTVNYSGGAILDSPYEAFEFVSGSGDGYSASGINISNVNVANVGTTVMQAETTGSASVSGVTASGVGVAGAYNYAYPSNTAGAYTFNLGSGNSGWSTTPVLTAYPEPVQAGTLTSSASALSFGDVNSGSTSSAQTVTVTNPGTSAVSVSSVSVTGDYSQTNTCGSSIAAGGSCTVSVKFSPTSGGPLTGTLSVATSAPGSPLTVALSGTGVTATTNLALGQPATASSDYETYVPANVTDGNTSSYWESADGAGYPQTLTVQLPSDESIGSLQLYLPPATAWSTRTETLSVLGSANGTSFSQIVGSAGYTFNPSTGNEVTISLPSGTTAEYVELSFTGNTGWSAAQLSELEVFSGGGGTGPTGAPLTASPTSLSFGNEATGSTSAAQTVTVSNPGGTAATVSSVSASAPFAETNTCGGSIAAGGSCTVSVTYAPTATGASNGTLSVASSAPSSPLTVALTGTGVSGATALTASPTSVSFGSVPTGSTSAAQTVTVTNPGSTAATGVSVSAAAPFAESNNTCGSSIAAGGSCTVSVTYAPTAAGASNGTLSVASSAPGSPLSVALSGTGVSTTTDLALNQPTTASGYTQNYVPGNAVDGNTSTYWESTDNAFPQWFQVDLGSSQTVGSIVMDLPPSSAWGTRTQTVTIQGSTNGTTYSTLVGSANYTFNPSTGNTVTVTFPPTSVRYLKLTFTANTGWPAGQLSELLVYA
jgi:F5/8 type C domain/Pectate lyase superfamily protein/Abnormal spindle-like microcephaly-assoc'd, ASPM-SPD-2-Hydin